MKSLLYLSLVFAFSLNLTAMEIQSEIIGKWNVVKLSLGKNMEDHGINKDYKLNYNFKNDGVVTISNIVGFEEQKVDCKYTLSRDGALSIDLGERGIQVGKVTIDNEKLNLVNDSGQNAVMEKFK